MAWNKTEQPIASPKTGKRLSWRTCGFVVLLGGLMFACVVCWMRSGDSSKVAVVQRESPRGKGKIVRHEVRAKVSPRDAVRKAMPKTLPKRVRKHRERRGVVEMFGHLSGEDRRMAEAVQNALDADDLNGVVQAAQESLSSTNAEVRLNAVDALGWFGAEALPELTGCMADADEDVRETAANHWELAVQDVERPEERFALVGAALGTLSDEDQLRFLGGMLSSAATEMIDGADDDEKTAENRITVLQTLVDIIEAGSERNMAAAKEAYSDITGNDWISVDEAERYLADPESYEAPET